ncbi:MAG: TIM-barrel domain-containing protein [Janthinobacterium lividum]
MNKPVHRVVCCFGIAVYFFAGDAAAQSGNFKKVANGVVLTLPENQQTKLLQLDVVGDKIIHVKASPVNEFSADKSLMAVPQQSNTVKWSVSQTGDFILLKTASLQVKSSLKTGVVSFMDAAGKPVLQEAATDSKNFVPVSNDGEASYQLKQVFQSPADEGFYGLGQHQNGVMNYKGQQVELLQANTEVAVPFLVSSKNYGILWDNYSITKVGDTRNYQPLSGLKLFSKEGDQGWLTATYADKTDPKKVFISRPESDLDYSFLKDMKNFPAGYKLENGLVTYEGSIESPYSGLHHFLTKYSGYVKVYIDGKLIADKWRQPWNPGTALTAINLEKGKKYSFKIEWIPDGGESYLAMHWLSPIPEKDKNTFAFSSEAGDDINYYFVYGKNSDEVISGYRTITGKATMMPKWAMGFWQSRERYKTQEEILTAAKEFRDRKIPIDNIVEDWSYWKQDQWGSQEFDETRFPDPKGMIKQLHDEHMHIMLSVWAKFYEGIKNYDYLNKNGWLYKRNIANRQRDWIAQGYVSTFYDAFNPKARQAFWDLMNKNLYSKGIDAWWMDASEPDILSNSDITSRKEQSTPTFLGSSTKYFNAFPLENAQGIYEGQRGTNPNDRVFLLTRSAYAGLQRYATATWSGDIAARWEDFKAQIPAGINFSMSGIPYWTMDVGGFAVERRYEKPNEKDLAEWREQMTRWYQFGAFVPLFRVHGQFPFREIYNVAPENHPAYQSMLYYDKLRYHLMPYIYSLVGKTYQKDYTLMRGLVMDFGTDEKVKSINDQYMFGPSLLINPVYQYQAKNRKVYLPAGNGWFDLYSGKYQNGGQEITADAPYERIPVFVKEGSILPVGPDIQYTSEKPDAPITLYVYAGKDASFNLYEDEGTNYNYEKGAFSTISINYSESSKTLTIGNRKGTFPGMVANRVFNVVVISKNKPKALNFETAANQTVKYAGNTVSLKMQ